MTVFKERPMLFSTLMVQAILAGRKTMTRRVVKKAPTTQINHRLLVSDEGWNWQVDQSGLLPTLHRELYEPLKCPYGQIGDHIWVKETFACVHFSCDLETGCADELWGSETIPIEPNTFYPTVYKAEGGWENDIKDRGFKWRPSIFMPRWASRILLEITDINVERLHDITDSDAIAEGIKAIKWTDGSIKYQDYVALIKNHKIQPENLTARWSFWSLWEAINGRKSFEENPWVWVISFKVVTP